MSYMHVLTLQGVENNVLQLHCKQTGLKHLNEIIMKV